MGEPINEAYLDIETTGLSLDYDRVTVIGISRGGSRNRDIDQLVNPDISGHRILETLKGVQVIYTFGGKEFDLPFLKRYYGVDLKSDFHHRDLRYTCRDKNLFGGLKAIERQLGIHRTKSGIDGREAVRLWWRYSNHQDFTALKKLLDYNKEDVINLKILRQILAGLNPVLG
jgi:uncharacterized protein YprB with RNaseH-like and TPR domain